MPTINETIVHYLETFGQPQFSWSIHARLREAGYKADDLNERLDSLVESGEIQTVDGGVDSAGNRQVCYAPVSFQG